MSRTLRSFIVAIVLAGVTIWLGALSEAANPRAGKAQVRRPKRPQAQRMRVEKLSPQLEQILIDWSVATGSIKKLQGEHTRFEFDQTWKVATVAVGEFYYEAPDKGRIDLRGADTKKVKITRKKYKSYPVKAAESERWICDGMQIMKIDDKQKSVNIFEVPPQARNQNIMDGPLPFLLGMPPDKAKKRFKIKLLKETKTEVWLYIKPKWQQDAAKWSSVTVILDKNRAYLPVAIQMFDPPGNRETLYSFNRKTLIANIEPRRLFGIKISGLGAKKLLFDPRLPGYKKNLIAAAKPRNIAGKKVPSVIGKSAKQAREVMRAAGYKIKWKRGDRPPAKKMNHIIYDQRPRAKANLAKGKTVWLTYYGYPRKKTATKPRAKNKKVVR